MAPLATVIDGKPTIVLPVLSSTVAEASPVQPVLFEVFVRRLPAVGLTRLLVSGTREVRGVERQIDEEAFLLVTRQKVARRVGKQVGTISLDLDRFGAAMHVEPASVFMAVVIDIA